jgi:hypothetical protein
MSSKEKDTKKSTEVIPGAPAGGVLSFGEL